MNYQNFYNEVNGPEKQQALAKLDKSIFQLRWFAEYGKPARKFRIKEIKLYFEIEGGPTKLLKQLQQLQLTYKTEEHGNN
jgi:hypothetical protein